MHSSPKRLLCHFVWFSALMLSFAEAAPVPRLAPGERWLAVASTQDLDTAIGISSYYGWKKAKVMATASGWYAIVIGPYDAATLAEVRAGDPDLNELPGDAFLSSGSKYLNMVWSEPGEERRRLFTSYAPGHPARFSTAGLEFEVQLEGDEDTPGSTIISAKDGDTALFRFVTGNEFTITGAEAALARLDPEAEVPQLVVTRFTGGAHCCTATWIATKPAGSAGWTLIDTGMLDGGGYSLEDLDDNGSLELVSSDNSFLYAFDSYAGSFAPLRYHKLKGGALQDETAKSDMGKHIRRNLAFMEFSAKVTPDLWNSNGFLAGWVATKMLLGEGDEAWERMEADHDKNSDFGPQECTTGGKVEDCASENLVAIPFPRALAEFLREKDYGVLPEKARAYLN